jgi:hypothetical protein
MGTKSDNMEAAIRLSLMLKRYAKGKPADHEITRDALALIGAAHSLHGLAEGECNYGLTPRQEKRRETLRAKVDEIAKRYAARPEHANDPRGFVVRLHFPGGEKNDWGEGWGIG